ncbi:hypothetical protein [Mycobacterium sp. SM3041]|uniref:hypothetical protein n=1 Tax=Mycobacterium sp. SM3041 TaxID=3114291 RepID=UPI0032047F76
MRNRLDFIQPGTVAGQITTVSRLVGNSHLRYRDGPDGEPIAEEVPGVDTEITLSGHPFTYRVRAELTSDGPKVLELQVDSPDHDVPITPDDMRKIAKLLDRLAYAATNDVDVSTSSFHRPEQPPPKRPGRKGHGDEFYAEVAEIAKAAHRERHITGESVRQRIARHFTVSLHSADKYLARARQAGHLQAGDLGGKSHTHHED